MVWILNAQDIRGGWEFMTGGVYIYQSFVFMYYYIYDKLFTCITAAPIRNAIPLLIWNDINYVTLTDWRQVQNLVT